MKHPAKFSDVLLPAAGRILHTVCDDGARILDPFAGTGKGVAYLRLQGFNAHGVELEPEWVGDMKFMRQGDALALPFKRNSYDAVFTSPCYGNRMADRDMRPSVAGTYMKALGREASEGSSCHLQWGDAYREFHEKAWREVARVLKPGGWFLLNIKDHYRGGKLQHVPEWHRDTLKELGFAQVKRVKIDTPSLRNGQNHESRVDYELLLLFQAPT